MEICFEFVAEEGTLHNHRTDQGHPSHCGTCVRKETATVEANEEVKEKEKELKAGGEAKEGSGPSVECNYKDSVKWGHEGFFKKGFRRGALTRILVQAEGIPSTSHQMLETLISPVRLTKTPLRLICLVNPCHVLFLFRS